jgi:hypothetical protein
MGKAPRRRELRSGRAAGVNSGLGYRLDTLPPQKSQYPRQLRRQRHVERICQTPRLVAELLAEIGRHHGIADDIDRRLERYGRLSPDLLHALGADRFPSAPIWAVR